MEQGYIDDILDMTQYLKLLPLSDLKTNEGKISKILGMTMEVSGLLCSIGDICHVIKQGKPPLICEVVGISGNKAFLMPYQETDDVGYGCAVINTGEKLTVLASDSLVEIGRASCRERVLRLV